MKSKFRLGQVVATPGAIEAFASEKNAKESFLDYLARHASGDWGDICSEDKRLNDSALKPGEEQRVLSAYTLPDGTRFWIITEWDRSATTLLLPNEY